jgi:hypothetical protein
MNYKQYFEGWSKEELLEYLEFLLHNYRVMDAFWFLNIEKRHDHQEACLINELVWGKTGQLAARDLKERFGSEGDPLQVFLKTQRIFPWAILVGYRFEDHGDHIMLKVDDCPSQTARLNRGMGEYDCKGMHLAEFKAFAQEIDPRIKVTCLYAPPDDHPADHFCQWRFELDEGL